MTDKLVLSKSSIVAAKKVPISAEYELGTKLNSGASGIVYIACHKATKQQRAVKAIKKDSENISEVMNEVEILSKLTHPNILQIFEVFQDKANYYIVSELCKGGELLDKIEETESILNINFVRSIMKQLLSVICYSHKVGVVHRDLKPENIMLEEKGGEDTIKVIDWGCALNYDGKRKLTSADGTAYYIAPEVLKQSYDEKCDIWSAGVIFYILLCGYPPFDAPSDDEIFELILKGNLEYPKEEWDNVDKNAFDLVKKMLTYDPAKRISAQDCLKHSFFSSLPSTNTKKEMAKSVFANMKKFNRNLKIENAAISYIVNNLISKEEKKNLANVFKHWDLNGDGVLSRDEIMRGYKSTYGNTVNEKEIDELIKSVDLDGNGTIDYNEFLSFATQKDKLLNEKNLKITFNSFDTDGSGKISYSEIEHIFKKGNKNFGKAEQQSLMKLLKEADENGDGEISFSEFQTIMKKLS